MRIFRDKSEFNEILVVNTATWGKALILNGELQSTEKDQDIYHRSLCYGAMQPSARNILVLGGGEGATANLILKSGENKQVVMVEIDQKVVDICKSQIPSMGQNVWTDPRLTLIIGDAYAFVDKFTEQCDVIVSDLSSPTFDGISEQLFQKNFYEKVKKILRPGGLFLMQATDRPHLYWKDFKEAFPRSQQWSEWIPSFGVPWYFFGGANG